MFSLKYLHFYRSIECLNFLISVFPDWQSCDITKMRFRFMVTGQQQLWCSRPKNNTVISDHATHASVWISIGNDTKSLFPETKIQRNTAPKVQVCADLLQLGLLHLFALWLGRTKIKQNWKFPEQNLRQLWFGEWIFLDFTERKRKQELQTMFIC